MKDLLEDVNNACEHEETKYSITRDNTQQEESLFLQNNQSNKHRTDRGILEGGVAVGRVRKRMDIFGRVGVCRVDFNHPYRPSLHLIGNFSPRRMSLFTVS